MEILEALSPYLGVIVPVLVALVSRAEAPARLKRRIALGFAVLVGVLSVALADWGTFSEELLVERVLMAVGQAQLVYVAAREALERWTSVESPNQLPVFLPDKGVG